MKKENKGITLIALVVTIIVLLILAGISISMLTGKNGILNRAAEAKESSKNSQIDEMVKISVMDALASGNGKITEDLLTEALNKNLGSGNYTLTGNETEGWIVGANEKKYNISANGSITEKKQEISDSTWQEINALAKEIAKDSTITKDTDTVTKTVNGKNYTATVGDKKTITIDEKDYTVRILGFNHDTLENGQTAYGDASITKAGISFEFETLLPGAKMNASGYNTNGWGASLMRTNLNSTTAVDGMTNLSNIETAIGSNIIKSVTKSYIKTYNNASSVTTCNDKLWLLACSEIWSKGCQENAYGYAIASEGAQYKYYADINATYNSGNSKLYKMYQGSTFASSWWLRSPNYNYSDGFCTMYSNGSCNYDGVDNTYGVAPGFAI